MWAQPTTSKAPLPRGVAVLPAATAAAPSPGRIPSMQQTYCHDTSDRGICPTLIASMSCPGGGCRLHAMSHARPRRRITLIALTVVLALVLTSCFGDDEPDETTTTTTEQTSAPPPPPDPTPTTQPPVVETTTTTTEIIVVAPPDDPVVPPPDPPPPPPDDPVVDDTGALIYTVQAGDTLFSIAQRFGVSLDDVIEANNISNPDVIFEGETLTIPPAG